ncbi:hypothetical protein [Marinobacter sp. CHS3-4]|uniref:hypothetical protein n=1 Tax=Marinobacter sp. CHS3-4 TaxID=3045174 RepID=UPI0024B48203|nr:hypothetical protein [Marinobacter sp. CHS3-4]MDI9246673.1 hypothetical protein [Marinobacter sp. CHS3-4]
MINKYPQDAAGSMANSRRLRLAMVMTVLLVLSWLLLDSLEDALERAQEQSAKLTLNQIRSVLVVKGAEIRLSSDRHLEAQAGANPFEWFEEPPAGYTGICGAASPEPGKWCFRPLQTGNAGYKKAEQAGSGRVIFRPSQPINLEERQGSREAPLGWVVGIEFQDRNGNGSLDEDEPQSGLKLVPTTVTSSASD